MIQKIKINCKQCEKDSYVHPYRIITAKFCSRNCATRYQSLGKKNYFWKSGKHKHTEGYIWAYALGHPYATDNFVLEHRLIMEKHLGRYLDRKEIVHHINGVKDDNRIENLELIDNQSIHAKLHGLGLYIRG